jgi:hypothetical protein
MSCKSGSDGKVSPVLRSHRSSKQVVLSDCSGAHNTKVMSANVTGREVRAGPAVKRSERASVSAKLGDALHSVVVLDSLQCRSITVGEN